MKAGAQAELIAADFLKSQGLTLVKYNYRCRFGEIDLIAYDQKTLIFIEVRLRSHTHFGGAVASIDMRKQQRIILTAQHYLTTLSQTPPCRFDVVLLNKDKQIEWIKNAFEV